MPLKYCYSLFSGAAPTFYLVVKGKIVTMEVDLLGLVGLLVETVVKKAPTKGSITLLSIHTECLLTIPLRSCKSCTFGTK